MLEFSDQVNNLPVKVTQAMVATTWNHVIPEHKGICVAFFTFGISLKPVSNRLVGDMILSLWFPWNKLFGSYMYMFYPVSCRLLNL